MKRIIFLFSISLLTLGCTQDQIDNEILQKWRIVKSDKLSKERLSGINGNITLSEDEIGSLNVGCNKISFDFEHSKKNNKFNVSHMESTEMYCRNLTYIEISVSNSLKSITKYELKSDILILRGKNVYIECELF